MEERYKFYILNFLGVVFLVVGLAAIWNSLYLKNPMQVLWMCYLSLSFIGIGILFRKAFIVQSQLNILTIPLIIWNIDFWYRIIVKQPLWGITDYFFFGGALTLGRVISLQHLITVPIGLYAIYLIGSERKDSWKLSMVQAALVYIAVSLFTNPELNINCVFKPCINLYFDLPYQLTWFLIFFVLIIVTSVIINNLPFLKSRRSDKRVTTRPS